MDGSQESRHTVIMSEYHDLLREAYKGEVFGESFFTALGDGPHGVDHGDALRALAAIEAQTARRLQPLVDAAELDVDADTAARDGVVLAARVADQSWDGLVASLRGALPTFLAGFERLRAIASHPSNPVLIDLVAHEHAIDRFAALELDGQSLEALAVLEAHLATSASA